LSGSPFLCTRRCDVTRFLPLILALCLPALAENTLNYSEPGGARQVIGGELDVASGGELDIESGGALKIGGIAVSASAAELNLADGADRLVKVARVALAAADTAGGILAWANPTGGSILVTRFVL